MYDLLFMAALNAVVASVAGPLARRVPDGENLPFEEPCRCFDALNDPNAVADRHRRPDLMRKLWKAYGFYAPFSHDLFPLMRLTLPHLDTIRGNYHLKQKGLADMLIGYHGLRKDSAEAVAMTNWKKPSSGFGRNEQGNFPEVVHSLLAKRVLSRAQLVEKGRPKLTVGGLNELLDALAKGTDHAAKAKVFRTIFESTTGQEQRWILRIVLKDMHIGMQEDAVFRLLHPDAKQLYNSVCDLRASLRRRVLNPPCQRETLTHMAGLRPARHLREVRQARLADGHDLAAALHAAQAAELRQDRLARDPQDALEEG